MTFLSRDQLLKFTPKVVRTVALPGAEGAVVGIRLLSGQEREQFEKIKDDQENRNDVRAVLVALATCDEHGLNLFRREDADLLNKTLDGPTMAILYMAAMEANIVTQEAYDAALGKSTAPPSGSTP